jgi:hypothetical protein
VKKLGWTTIVVIIIATLVVLWALQAPTVSAYLTRRLGIPISIDRISFRPGRMTITDFKVMNPKGYRKNTAFKADKTEINYTFRDLVGSPSKIQSILIDKIFLDVEFSNPLGTRNNWTELAARMPKKERVGTKKGTMIGSLVLTNLTVSLRGLGFSTAPKVSQIARIELHNIDSAQGFPTELLIKQIFQGAGLMDYIKEAFDPGNVLQKALSPLRLFGENEEGK